MYPVIVIFAWYRVRKKKDYYNVQCWTKKAIFSENVTVRLFSSFFLSPTKVKKLVFLQHKNKNNIKKVKTLRLGIY